MIRSEVSILYKQRPSGINVRYAENKCRDQTPVNLHQLMCKHDKHTGKLSYGKLGHFNIKGLDSYILNRIVLF